MRVPYRFVTPRLVIRCYRPSDAELLKKAVDSSIEHLLPWMPWAENEPQTMDEKVDLCRRFRSRFDVDEDYTMAILDPDETEILGGTGLHMRAGVRTREIGYWVAERHVGHGYAAEAAAALTHAAFDYHGAARVEIRCDPANVWSAAIPRRLGFTMEARLRCDRTHGGVPRDTLLWSMIQSDIATSPIADLQYEAYDALGQRMG